MITPKTLGTRLLSLFVPLLLVSCTHSEASRGASEQSADTTIRNEYRLLFVGDIMIHGPQIKAARRPKLKAGYDFSASFDSISPLLRSADLCIGNLETTLAGKPYSGYPMFSSPDALAVALKEAGFDILTTANNHSADRGRRGIVRTLDLLDSLGIAHTGSYRKADDREQQTPLVVELEGSIKLGILAYTYGTNGMPIPKPTQIDLIDTLVIAQDLERAQRLGVDYQIVQIHWGEEYRRDPSSEQTELARWLHRQGVDAVIGSHPHVVQRSEWLQEEAQPTFVLYSLGNFISNQIKPEGTRAGLMLELRLVRQGSGQVEAFPSYHFVFVNKRTPEGQAVYRLVPMPLSSDVPMPPLPKDEQADWRAALRYYQSLPLVGQRTQTLARDYE